MSQLPIICKITPWFLLRIGAIIALLAIFSIAFYVDGTKKYKEKNWEYYSYQPFKLSGEKYKELIAHGEINKQQWKRWIDEQPPIWPEEGYAVISAQANLDETWPKILYQLADNSQQNYQKIPAWQLWETYSADYPFQASHEPEHPYTLKQIQAQFKYFYLCLVLVVLGSLATLLLSKQTLSINEEDTLTFGFISIPQEQWLELDDEKWKTKGIAHLKYLNQANKDKKIRIDGFVYGGFNDNKQVSSENLISYIQEKIKKNKK